MNTESQQSELNVHHGMMRRHRILFVDDEPSIRIVVRESLQSVGYDVETAEDGEEALELLERESFDLVLVDIAMPRMNGIELLQEMRKGGIQPRIIVLTGVNEYDVAIEATKLGANDYFTKPFDADAVIAAADRVLSGTPLRDVREP